MTESTQEDLDLAEKGRRMTECRQRIIAAFGDMSNTECLSVLTTMVAESMVKAADSREQYDQMVDMLSEILTNYPLIAQVVCSMTEDDEDNGRYSVKH